MLSLPTKHLRKYSILIVLALVCHHHLCLHCVLTSYHHIDQTIICQICLQQTPLSNQTRNFLISHLQQSEKQNTHKSSDSPKTPSKKLFTISDTEGRQSPQHVPVSNKLFCMNCFCSFQVQQYLTGPHLSHKVMGIQGCYPKVKERMQQWYQTLMMKEGIFKSKVVQIEQKMAQLDTDEQRVNNQIERCFILLFKSLKRQQNRCRQEVNNNKKRMSQRFQSEKLGIESSLNQISGYIHQIQNYIKDPYPKQPFFNFIFKHQNRINELAALKKHPVKNTKLQKIRFEFHPDLLQKCCRQLALVIPLPQLEQKNSQSGTTDTNSVFTSSSRRGHQKWPVDVSFKLKQRMIIDPDVYSIGYRSPSARIKQFNYDSKYLRFL